MAKRLADNVTIYMNGNASATDGIKTILSSCKPESKTRKCISIDDRKITKFVKGSGENRVEVHLEDGTIKREGFVPHKPKSPLNGDWVEQPG
jgi:hypothetical protein